MKMFAIPAFGLPTTPSLEGIIRPIHHHLFPANGNSSLSELKPLNLNYIKAAHVAFALFRCCDYHPSYSRVSGAFQLLSGLAELHEGKTFDGLLAVARGIVTIMGHAQMFIFADIVVTYYREKETGDSAWSGKLF